MRYYSKNLKFEIKARVNDIEYEYLHHVAINTGKTVNVVLREIIDKEILKNGYKKTSGLYNMEHNGISGNEIKWINR